jgi:hypothetical protein
MLEVKTKEWFDIYYGLKSVSSFGWNQGQIFSLGGV